MGKKITLLMAALLLCGAFAACGSQEEPSSSSSTVSVSAAEEESSQPQLRPEPRTVEGESSTESPVEEPAEESAQEEVLVLIQQDSGMEAGGEPTITLHQDGSFTLNAVFYDGAATISGTYAQQGESYVLTPLESTAQGTEGSQVGEITLTPQDGGFAYGGDQLGVTFDGAVFLPSQQ